MALRRTLANLNFQRHDKKLQRHRRRQPRCQCRGQQRKVLPSQQRKQRLAKGRLTESIPNKEMNGNYRDQCGEKQKERNGLGYLQYRLLTYDKLIEEMTEEKLFDFYGFE